MSVETGSVNGTIYPLSCTLGASNGSSRKESSNGERREITNAGEAAVGKADRT